MPKRELAALRRDAERDAEQEREILRRRIESVCGYCNRASETGKCLCFSNFNAAMAGGDDGSGSGSAGSGSGSRRQPRHERVNLSVLAFISRSGAHQRDARLPSPTVVTSWLLT